MAVPLISKLMSPVDRRTVIRGAGGLFAVSPLVGCLGSRETDAEPPRTASPTSELDLREANVVDVEITAAGAEYTVAVTLHHDDDGEAGYANWWQVETLDGTRLGRRELLHAHSDQPFTRSTTIEIPADVTCVVVRGHDQTHEYGGQAMVVNLDGGETRRVNQGSMRQAFDTATCP